MGRSNRLFVWLPVLFFILLPGVSLRAQIGQPDHIISGIVFFGQDRTADQRVRVRLYAPGGGLRDEIYTEAAGKFEFRNLPAGDYRVEAWAPGYTTVQQSVSVLPFAGYRAVVNFNLPVERPAGPQPPSGIVDIRIPPKARQHWEKAQDAMRSGKADRARKELEEAVKADKDFGAAYRLLGMLALDDARLDDADTALTRAIALLPGDAETTALEGAVLNRRNRAADAVPLLEKAATADARCWRAQFELAQAHFALKHYVDALPHARVALELRGRDFAEGHVLLGNLFMNLKQYPQAAEQFVEFLKLAPGSPSAAAARETLNKMKQAGVPVPQFR